MTDHETLWCVRLIGPDDMLACASRADAVRHAMALNLGAYRANLDPDPMQPLVVAVPEPWPYDPRSHAAGLALLAAEDQTWIGGPRTLAELAATVFSGEEWPS